MFGSVDDGYRAYKRRLARNLLIYIALLLGFVACMVWAERRGLPRHWIGPIFLFVSIMAYAAIGIRTRTMDTEEYYVAGRRIPAMYNGMAAAADWMSAASFISLAGGLYLQGFSGSGSASGGLAYILGWTGGFCLVALLMAPYLRRMRIYTVPDYFGERFGGSWPRIIAAMAAVLCSFTYVVAQIYGIGLIASRLTGVQFEIGILLGLGGVLVCSFLGGMRAITWTQVAQYVLILIAFLIPVSWLAYKQLGNPVAPVAYGQQLARIAEREAELLRNEGEQGVAKIYAAKAREYEERLKDVPAALAKERADAQERVRALKSQGADSALVVQAFRDLSALPRDPDTARELWRRAAQEAHDRAAGLGGLPPHSQPYPVRDGVEEGTEDPARWNFMALVFCLMVGTAGLPHLLTRYYTTPTVAEARSSVAWTIFFVALVYLSAPALAVLVKFEILNTLVGSSFDSLPHWIAQWGRVDSSLISVTDLNGDRVVQFGEVRLAADMIMLATPELGGLPYAISGLVAAGGLAAALSTADALLLTISNALVRDVYCNEVNPRVSPDQRVVLSKFVLLAVALIAAVVASLKPGEILQLVAASFSLAGAAFVPAMVLGIFWRGMTREGAVAAMLSGLGVTVLYMVQAAPVIRAWLGWTGDGLLFGIHGISAAAFGVPIGALVGIAVSLWVHRR